MFCISRKRSADTHFSPFFLSIPSLILSLLFLSLFHPNMCIFGSEKMNWLWNKRTNHFIFSLQLKVRVDLSTFSIPMENIWQSKNIPNETESGTHLYVWLSIQFFSFFAYFKGQCDTHFIIWIYIFSIHRYFILRNIVLLVGYFWENPSQQFLGFEDDEQSMKEHF